MRPVFPTFVWPFDQALDNARGSYRSRSHVDETAEGYFIELDAPGIRKEELRISIENRHLVIEGERKGRVESRLRRVFSLPEDVDVSRIEAQLKDGVLELALHKIEQAKPKLIPIAEGKESFFQKLLHKEE